MPTWTAPLGITQEVARKLGRWRSAESSAAYTRQDQIIIGQVQAATAEYIRAFKPGEDDVQGDPFGEIAVLAALAQKLNDSGVSASLIDKTIANLSFFKGGKYTPPKLQAISGMKLLELKVDEFHEEDEQSASENRQPQIMDLLGEQGPPSPTFSPPPSDN